MKFNIAYYVFAIMLIPLGGIMMYIESIKVMGYLIIGVSIGMNITIAFRKDIFNGE
jgi:hypothetical protein